MKSVKATELFTADGKDGKASGKQPQDTEFHFPTSSTAADDALHPPRPCKCTGNQTGGDGNQCAEQRQKARNTAKMTNDEPPKFAADTFIAAREAIPAADLCRTWASVRTIMLRMS